MQIFIVLAIMIISAILEQALAPKQPDATASTQADFDIPQADEGKPQAVVFGDSWCDAWEVLALGNFRTEPIKSS